MTKLEPKYVGKVMEVDETVFRNAVSYNFNVLIKSINELNDEVYKLIEKPRKKHTLLKVAGIIFAVKSAYNVYKLETKVSKLEEQIESMKKEDSEW